MSELGAVDAPHSILMNVFGFQLLGVFMIAYGFGLYQGISKGWDSKIGVIFIVIAGASMVAVGFFPCDPGCVNVSPTGFGHVITSMIPAIAMPFGIFFVMFRLRKDSQWQGYWLFSLAITIIAIILSPLAMVPYFGPWVGVLQRIGIGVPLFWMEVMSIKLLRLSIGQTA